MTIMPDDEDAPADRIAGLDLAELAALMAQAKTEGDAYDVLREVLSTLTAQAREPDGTTH
ncbi:hypothetical protein [Aestuariivirga litoralis]|uniref:hypothetical protein n=1 Tax=Aestuariivirga litoralis TaxID=2650924 RepID=UPI00137A7235|nr:hypothetical protein [Aestuariivirga litoralis]